MSLGILIWLVITPNVGLVNVVFGLPNSTLLVALNDSARNCALIRSVIKKFLNTEKSQSNSPGPRVLINRLTSPKVKRGASENAAGFNQSLRRWSVEPAVVAETPVALGR